MCKIYHSLVVVIPAVSKRPSVYGSSPSLKCQFLLPNHDLSTHQSSLSLHSYQKPIDIINKYIEHISHHIVLTVGTYSEGNLLVVYDIKRQV